jgi:dTDP-4-amino-4,6-dideoxygalactose transaminase
MIEFNKPFYNDEELECVKDALLNDTDYYALIKSDFSEYLDQKNIFFTCNGSSALEMLFVSMNFKEGEEVIMPSFNFPSAANSALRMGAKPVFADINADTLTIDLNEIIDKTTKNTICINPIHYGGASIDMDLLMSYAKEKEIKVLEDAALAFGGEYKNKKLGTIGDFGIFSFDKTKNISCGKGGLAVVNSELKELNKRITRIFNNGTDKEEFLQNKVNCYSWKQLGLSVAMSNLTAAVLYAQSKKREAIENRRKSVYEFYNESLLDISEKFGLKISTVPKYNKNNHHVFYIIFPSNEQREKVRMHLKEKDIYAHVHYTPLHLSKMGKSLGYNAGDMPRTEKIAQTMLRLPLHNCMDVIDAEQVLDAIKEAL